MSLTEFLLCDYDEVNDCYLAARDHIGIVPFYLGWDIARQSLLFVGAQGAGGGLHEDRDISAGSLLLQP
jgi:asparagine synthetase B (glutamine-hydrolysing)